MDSIADRQLSVNSHSLVNKVRFVAVTLLDSVLSPDPGTIVEGSSAQMNQEALMSFLGILSEIEQVSLSRGGGTHIIAAHGVKGLVNDQHST